MDIRTLKQRLDAAGLDSLRLQQPNPNTISNLIAFKTAVEQLADLPPLAPLVERIRRHTLYNQNTDAVSTDPQTIAQLTNLAEELRAVAIGIRDFLATS